MANKKNQTKKVEKIEEVKETKPEVKEEKLKTIKIGTKVIVNGRTFGSHTLEAPMKTLRNDISANAEGKRYWQNDFGHTSRTGL